MSTIPPCCWPSALVHGLPPSRQPDDSPQAQAQDTIRFFQTRLVTHFRAEEQALFPLIRKTQPHAIPLLDTLLAEHTDMRGRVQALEQADPAELPAQLTAFGRLLERHVRSEERELFSACEARLSADEAERLRAAIAGFVGEGR